MSINLKRFGCLAGTLAVRLLTGMSADQSAHAAGDRSTTSSSSRDRIITAALRAKVHNIVVIYAENRAFDNLYGNFPGAHGLRGVIDEDGHPRRGYLPQKDRDGSVLATLPPTWGGVTAAGVTPVVTQAQSTDLPNAPFSVEATFGLSTFTVTRDLYHRFFENQMEIDGGKNDKFAAWADVAA